VSAGDVPGPHVRIVLVTTADNSMPSPISPRCSLKVDELCLQLANQLINTLELGLRAALRHLSFGRGTGRSVRLMAKLLTALIWRDALRRQRGDGCGCIRECELVLSCLQPLTRAFPSHVQRRRAASGPRAADY